MYIKVNGNKATHLQVETYYSKGGYNLFYYTQEKRGYYVSVKAVEKKTTETGLTTISYSMFNGGYKKLIQETGRFNKSTLAKLDNDTIENARELIDRVLAEQNLTLAEDIDQAWNNHVNGIVA